MKIIEITNHHQWDGVEMSEKSFMELINVLQMSKYAFTCKVENDKGVIEYYAWNGGR